MNNQAATPAPIAGATLLSGTAPTDSLAASFAAGDTITVSGTPITFVASGATGNQLSTDNSVQALLAKIDSITGTSTPSTVNGGAIALHGGGGESLTVSSSNATAFAALGFSGASVRNPAPLRVDGPPFATATNLVGGTSANTSRGTPVRVGTDSAARGTAVARVDQSVTAAVRRARRPKRRCGTNCRTSPCMPRCHHQCARTPMRSAQIAALQQRISANLAPQSGSAVDPGFAHARRSLPGRRFSDQGVERSPDAAQGNGPDDARHQIEGINQDEVATKILALYA